MAPRPVFSLVKCDLRTELCRYEGLVGLPVVLPKVPAAFKLVMHTRFRRPLHRRSLHRGVPRHRNGHDPHWLQGFPDRRALTAPSGPGWRHRRRDRPERRACAALRDTRAAPGPAARRAGDPVRRSARGGRSTPGAAGILSRPANASPRRAVRWRTAVVRRRSQRQDSARLPEPSLTSLPDQPGLYGLTLLVDMPFIVRHKDRGALRLDHRHDQALCRRRATGSAKSFVIGVS